MKQFIFILLSALCCLAHAQQSNHWVVQGFIEQFNIDTLLYQDAIKKSVYYDIDFNEPEIKVSEIVANKIWEIPKQQAYPIFHKLGQGYQSISDEKGELVAFIYCNTLFSKNGDSIDYIPQMGGKRGIASVIEKTDTFILYYIRSKTNFSGPSFEYDLLTPSGQPHVPYSEDTFFLVQSKYFKNKHISTKRVDGFCEFGNLSLLQSNVKIFTSKSKEIKLQFVWDQQLYEFNTSNNTYRKKRILNHSQINANYKSNIVWFDHHSGRIASELVTSPSGRWSIFNWYYDHYNPNKKDFDKYNFAEYTMSKVIVIDNENDLSFRIVLQDSAGQNTKETFDFWKTPVFTKTDSVVIIPVVNSKRNPWGNYTIGPLNELTLQTNSFNIKKFDIKLDSGYFGINDVKQVIRDFSLGPNGINYVLLKRVINKPTKFYSNLNLRQVEIGELCKINGVFTVRNPIKVLYGITDELDSRSIVGGLWRDNIFFPATPTPYHYINFKYKSLCNDLTHEFTNETDTNWFDHFWWFWGDGDSTKSVKSQTKIRHQYTTPGKYKVLLKSITADGGWVWYSDSVEILPEPIAKYYTKNTVGCQWIAVEFSDSSILEKKSHTWKWDFGDGNDTTLTSPGNIMPKNKSIKHTYTTSGKFNVQLQVSDGRCTDSFNAIQNISILPAPRPGIAIDKTSGCTPLEVQFGRTYSDPTDSTIYHFKPVISPTNYFDQAINKARLTQSGKYQLLQKLFGPSGCITQDSIALNITQGVEEGLKPFLKRSTVVNNSKILAEWQTVPAAKNYQLYRNGMPLAVVNDTFYLDALGQEIDQSYRYQIQPIDSCDKTVALRSNVGKTIFLKVVEQAQVSVNEFPTALLTWTPYEDWSLSGGVQNYVCVGNLDRETANWQQIANQVDTQFNDKQFIERSKFEKCYRIQARSADGRFVTESNIACLGYTATLFAPDAFTPNGDGLNDAFEIFNYGFDRFTLSVYDRWGQKIYEASSSEAIWKPTSDVPTGVYVYQVKAYRKDKEYGFSSTVTLLR